MRAASSPPIRSFSFCGPANAIGTVHLLVEGEPDEERERIARDQPVRLVRVREVERLGHDTSVRRGR